MTVTMTIAKTCKCKWDKHEGRGKRVKIQECHVILTNFYDENAHFSIRVRGQRFSERFLS